MRHLQKRAGQLLLTAMAFMPLGCERHEPYQLPELPVVVAESEYIEYSTWADAEFVCMDDHLGDLDPYLEATAAFLAVELPERKIRYVWIPRPLMKVENWGCLELGVLGCYVPGQEQPFVFSANTGHLHELAHAVSIEALGLSHPVLNEGLAVYLGEEMATDMFVADFPALFTAMLDRGVKPDTYPLALQYVGSVLERHGVESFKELWRRMPVDADAETFATTHEAVYGEEFTAALARMDVPIRSRLPFPCDGEPIPWDGDDDLTVRVHGECGDGAFYGGGLVDSYPAFYKQYVVEVPARGVYSMNLRDPGDPTALTVGTMVNCPGVAGGVVGTYNGEPSAGLLHPGRHRLLVGFPAGPELRGELELTLRYDGDPDAAPVDTEPKDVP